MQDLFTKAALNSVFKIVELDGLCGTYEGGNVFWNIKKLLNVGSEAVLRKCVKEDDEFVYKLIKTKIEQVHNSHSFKLIKPSALVLSSVLFV